MEPLHDKGFTLLQASHGFPKAKRLPSETVFKVPHQSATTSHQKTFSVLEKEKQFFENTLEEGKKAAFPGRAIPDPADRLKKAKIPPKKIYTRPASVGPTGSRMHSARLRERGNRLQESRDREPREREIMESTSKMVLVDANLTVDSIVRKGSSRPRQKFPFEIANERANVLNDKLLQRQIAKSSKNSRTLRDVDPVSLTAPTEQVLVLSKQAAEAVSREEDLHLPEGVDSAAALTSRVDETQQQEPAIEPLLSLLPLPHDPGLVWTTRTFEEKITSETPWYAVNKVQLSPCKGSTIHAKFMRIRLPPSSPPPIPPPLLPPAPPSPPPPPISFPPSLSHPSLHDFCMTHGASPWPTFHFVTGHPLEHYGPAPLAEGHLYRCAEIRRGESRIGAALLGLAIYATEDG